MENKEVVSIVIPIYNVEACLRKCLETIVNQTYPRGSDRSGTARSAGSDDDQFQRLG